MEPGTDGESELPITGELRGWRLTLILKSELPLTRDLRGWSLGLMERP